jgi:DNA polymerase III sliding clamp (beta) subunit (PCNA family)
MQQFSIKLSTLKGLVILSAKKDIRYYLQSIQLEFNSKFTRCIATNGHVLGINQENQENEGAGSVLVPREIIDNIKVSKKDLDHIALFTQISEAKWSIKYMGNEVIFSPLDGKFPDYSRVVNQIKTSGEPAFYNFEYLIDFSKVVNTIGATLLNLHYNGNSGGLITCSSPDFTGIIMPIRQGLGSIGLIVDSQLYNPLIEVTQCETVS